MEKITLIKAENLIFENDKAYFDEFAIEERINKTHNYDWDIINNTIIPTIGKFQFAIIKEYINIEVFELKEKDFKQFKKFYEEYREEESLLGL